MAVQIFQHTISRIFSQMDNFAPKRSAWLACNICHLRGQEAAFISGPDKTLFLVVVDSAALLLKVFHLTRTEGYRGLQAGWSAAQELQDQTNWFHAISCAQYKWQLQVCTHVHCTEVYTVTKIIWISACKPFILWWSKYICTVSEQTNWVAVYVCTIKHTYTKFCSS